MSNKDISDIVGGSGSYEGYEAQVELAKTIRKKCTELKDGGQMPKGIGFYISKNKYLYLQFKNPFTGSRVPQPVNVPFDESGIYQARDKAWKIKDALGKFTTASEFDGWFKREIQGVNETVNDLKTYREIIQELEDEYFNGLNMHTKRPRSRDIANDVKTWKEANLHFFKKIPDWDKCPTWEEFKTTFCFYKKGTNSFEKCYYAMRRIAEKCPNSKQLLAGLKREKESKPSIIVTRQELNVEMIPDERNQSLRHAPMCARNGANVSTIALRLKLRKLDLEIIWEDY